jgi:hypothetical protein
MFNQVKERLYAGDILDMQAKQFSNVIYIEGTVPEVALGGQQVFTLTVSNFGDFLCKRMTGNYTTQVLDGGVAKDDGTNHLRCQLTDSGNGVNLFDDHVPLDMFLSPGRVRTNGVIVAPGALAVNPSSNLFYPMELEYLFKANTDILFSMKNDSTYANTFRIALFGLRLRRYSATPEKKKAAK